MTYTTPSRAMQQVDAAAQSLRTRRPELTHQQAIAAALKANPKIYDAYLAENPRQTGGR